MPVVYGAVFALVAALVWMAVPWRRLVPGRRPRASVKAAAAGFDRILAGDGFDIATHLGTEVTSVRSFANGSTQVWLKRGAA